MLFNTRYQPLISDEFFSELTSAFNKPRTADAPAVSFEIAEFADKFSLELDLPGLAKSDITIDLNDSLLVVSGERKAAPLPASASSDAEDATEALGANSPVVRSTRRYGHFQKSFKLPDTVDKEHIAAAMADGVLTLTLPKRAKKETRIAIDG